MKGCFLKCAVALVLALTLGLSALGADTRPGVSNRFPFGGVRTATITATETLYSGTSAAVQKLNPSTASRSVVLPSEADSTGLFYILVNTGTTYDLNVKASDGTTAVITVTPGFSAMVVCDGTTWYTGGSSSASTATLSVGAIAASDSSLDITGQAGSAGSAGGSVNRTAGAGDTNGAGGTITDTGGAGAGTGAGGALARVGGASGSGATGNGGAVSNTGGAALSTNGNGGAATMTGGVATGTGTGGAITLTSGASGGGTGTAGSVTIDTGSAAGGTAGTMSIGATNCGAITIGRTGQTATFAGTPSFSASPTGDGVTRWAEVSVTAAEVKALAAAPKTLVSAPGSGKVLEFVSAVILLDYGTTQFAEDGGGSNLAVKYTDGSGVKVSEDIEMTGFITQNADYMTTTRAKTDVIVAKSGSENKALVLHNIGAGEIVTGDSVLRVKVAYRVWSTGF